MIRHDNIEHTRVMLMLLLINHMAYTQACCALRLARFNVTGKAAGVIGIGCLVTVRLARVIRLTAPSWGGVVGMPVCWNLRVRAPRMGTAGSQNLMFQNFKARVSNPNAAFASMPNTCLRSQHQGLDLSLPHSRDVERGGGGPARVSRPWRWTSSTCRRSRGRPGLRSRRRSCTTSSPGRCTSRSEPREDAKTPVVCHANVAAFSFRARARGHAQMRAQGVPAPVGAAYALAPMMLRFSAVLPWNVGRRPGPRILQP